MAIPAGYEYKDGAYWKEDDASGPYAIDSDGVPTLMAGGGGGGGGSGTVTNTLGALVDDALVIGNAGDDVKTVGGLRTDGVSQAILGEAGVSKGSVKFENETSGSITLTIPDTALGSISFTMKAETRPLALLSDVAAVAGSISWKNAVHFATTVAGTLATGFEAGDTQDGYVLVAGNRGLIKNQAAGAENGIYTINASGPPTRATDADTGAELLGASCLVINGTTNANTQWLCTTPATIVPDTTPLTFVQINVSGT